MKQIKILLLLAAAAIMVACEPEKIVPEPEQPTPEEPTYLTSLVGTVWNRHVDFWMTAYGVDIHTVVDYDLFFLTDSTGKRRTYSQGAENFPAMDITTGFYYRYDTTTRVGFIEDSSSSGITINEFLYDVEQEALVFSLDPEAESHVIYTRVQ
jgi:hypothetical protein